MLAFGGGHPQVLTRRDLVHGIDATDRPAVRHPGPREPPGAARRSFRPLVTWRCGDPRGRSVPRRPRTPRSCARCVYERLRAGSVAAFRGTPVRSTYLFGSHARGGAGPRRRRGPPRRGTGRPGHAARPRPPDPRSPPPARTRTVPESARAPVRRPPGPGDPADPAVDLKRFRVAAARAYGLGQCVVGDWRDVTAVAAGSTHTLGLRTDGTVVAAGNDANGQYGVRRWRMNDI